MPYQPVIRFLLAVLPAMLACSCTTVRTRTLDQGDVSMSEAEFAAQVERVFRYHNRIMNELISDMAALQSDDDAASQLTEAEEDMDEACEPLNEVISDEAVFRSSNFWTKRKLPEAVPECEEATWRVETLLRQPLASGHGGARPGPTNPGAPAPLPQSPSH